MQYALPPPLPPRKGNPEAKPSFLLLFLHLLGPHDVARVRSRDKATTRRTFAMILQEGSDYRLERKHESVAIASTFLYNDLDL